MVMVSIYFIVEDYISLDNWAMIQSTLYLLEIHVHSQFQSKIEKRVLTNKNKNIKSLFKSSPPNYRIAHLFRI
jgi:hypothetical protein